MIKEQKISDIIFQEIWQCSTKYTYDSNNIFDIIKKQEKPEKRID